jgi:putative ABC transport system permease protein
MTATVNGAINAVDVRVAGIVSTGTPEADLYFLQIPLSLSQSLLRTQKISRLVVLLNQSEETAPAAAALTARLGPGAEVRTWRQLAPVYEQVLALYSTQFVVFGFIICLVVFLAVATMTLTNIFERSREIGIMRAIGIAAQRVRLLYGIEGLVQGIAGALAGMGVALCVLWLTRVVRISLPPPPGRNVRVPLQLVWVPEYALAIGLAFPVIAAAAAFLMSRRIARERITKLVSSVS